MIKLVASDLDGTLLNSKKELSDTIVSVIQNLEEKGVHFAAASGRRRDNLEKFFAPLKIASVSDNGGTAYDEDGNLLYVAAIDYSVAHPALVKADSLPYSHLVICGVGHVYVLADETPEHKAFTEFCFPGAVVYIHDFSEAWEDDQITKISLSTGRDGSNEDDAFEVMKQFDGFTCCLSGDGWVDLMKEGVDKGGTFKKLCQHYGLTMEETMAFGDYDNDYGMLIATPNSYAMKNAYPSIKAICNYETKYTNEEDGVSRELVRIFDLPMEEMA